MALYEYKIATEAAGVGGLTNVESLATPVPAPKSTFEEYLEQVQLGDGTVRGAGWMTATWHWDVLSQAQRNQLRTYCTGASEVVYIRTRKNDSSDAYANYKAVMIWPSEEKTAGRRLDFTLRFQALELQT